MGQLNQYPTPTLPLDGTEVVVIAQTRSGTTTTNSATIFDLMPKFTVANLPSVTAADQGKMAYATDGRNTGEGSGAGTGCLVTVNSNGVFAAVWSGVQVTS